MKTAVWMLNGPSGKDIEEQPVGAFFPDRLFCVFYKKYLRNIGNLRQPVLYLKKLCLELIAWM